MNHNINIEYCITLQYSAEVSDSKMRKVLKPFLDPDEKWAEQRDFCFQSWAEEAADQSCNVMVSRLTPVIEKLELKALAGDGEVHLPVLFKLEHCRAEYTDCTSEHGEES